MEMPVHVGRRIKEKYSHVPYILVYKSNFLDVKMGSKNRPRLIFGTYLPNHKKMPKFTATSQVTELSK